MSRLLFSSKLCSGLKTLKVGVVCGGRSAERRISLRSGRAILGALARSGVNARLLDPAKKDFFLRAKLFDILFLALHGNGGEDGILQAMLEKKRIPFTASGSKACKKSFNKLVTKKYLLRLGVPTPRYVAVNGKNWKKKAQRFPVPYFVKPLDGGSSQGVILVEDFKKSAEKIKRLVLRYHQLLIEEKIRGREVTSGILVDKTLPVVEVRPKRSFYDYTAKYTKGMTEYLVPAPIPDVIAKKIRRLAWQVYRGLGLSGFARVDLMLDAKLCPYVLEVNSIPGMTELSLVPKAAREEGISFEDLCLRILVDGLNRFRKR